MKYNFKEYTEDQLQTVLEERRRKGLPLLDFQALFKDLVDKDMLSFEQTAAVHNSLDDSDSMAQSAIFLCLYQVMENHLLREEIKDLRRSHEAITLMFMNGVDDGLK